MTVRFLTVFSSTEKNGKKPKKGPSMRVLFRNDGLRRVRRRGKERQALRETGIGVRQGSNTPAPRRGTANLIRSARSPYPRGTPQNEFRRLAVHPGNIPAEPDKPRQDPGETGKKVSQNLCKIWSGRVPGASGSGPGTLPERASAKKIQKHKFRPLKFQ